MNFERPKMGESQDHAEQNIQEFETNVGNLDVEEEAVEKLYEDPEQQLRHESWLSNSLEQIREETGVTGIQFLKTFMFSVFYGGLTSQFTRSMLRSFDMTSLANNTDFLSPRNLITTTISILVIFKMLSYYKNINNENQS